MVTQSFRHSLIRTALIGALMLSGTFSGIALADDQWEQCQRADVKALKVFTVGEAALYRKDCNVDDLLTPPVKLAFRYFREVPGDAFGKAAMHFLEKNLSESEFDAMKGDLASFNQHYQDVDDGDRYTLVYQDSGLTLGLNGQRLTAQEGDDFARAYLTIWFGPTPYSTAMKETLLGQR